MMLVARECVGLRPPTLRQGLSSCPLATASVLAHCPAKCHITNNVLKTPQRPKNSGTGMAVAVRMYDSLPKYQLDIAPSCLTRRARISNSPFRRQPPPLPLTPQPRHHHHHRRHRQRRQHHHRRRHRRQSPRAAAGTARAGPDHALR